jgi:hypothetical protein
MKNLKKYQISLMYILFLVVQTVQSQDFGFDDDVQDVPQAPIDNFIIPAIVMMVLFVLLTVYNRQKQTKV